MNENMNMTTDSFNKLRRCAYDPTADLITVKYDDSGKEAFYLQVPHRIIWFHQYCTENGLHGVIDDGDVTYIPELGLVKAVATVLMDNVVVGRSAAGCVVNVNDMESVNNAVQTAATRAKGRALANAGFGTPAGQGNPGESGDMYPCDAGMPFQTYPQMVVSGGQVVQPPVYGINQYGGGYAPVSLQPQVNPNEVRYQQSYSTAPAPKPAPSKPTPVNQMPMQPGMTLEQAQNFVVPSGRQAGKRLCELDASTVEYYATKSASKRYPEFIQAAKIVWADITARLKAVQ